jgi:ABC transport system ATP-binding/permease protein
MRPLRTFSTLRRITGYPRAVVERLPQLTITAGGQEHRFADQQLIRLGRDPRSDVVVDAPAVSRSHATVERTAEGWVFRDAGSSYGVYRGEERVSKLLIAPGERVALSLGQPHRGPSVEVEVTSPAADIHPSMMSLGRLTAVHELGRSETIVIGRDPSADVVLVGDMTASRRHAEIRSHGEAWLLHDMRSHNGTYVNGRRLEGTVTLRDGDLVGVGASVYKFEAGTLERYESSGEAWLLAIGLTSVVANGHRILDGVTFPLAPASLMAVIGPSGAGKTTLLGALTGFRPPRAGQLLYGGRDFYAAYEEFRSRTGYVPQDDVLHAGLTVSDALTFAARLRFAPDVDRSAREARVREVLDELNLDDRSGTRIDRLSGGQRKRVNVALELLTRPELLFLDEPTSGLDPGNEEQVMHLLRDLADGGRIVIVVTHSVASLELCDRLLFLAAGGKTAYFGTPTDATAYFLEHHGTGRFSEAFRQLDEERERDWSGEYESSDAYPVFVQAPIAQAQYSASLAAPAQASRPAGGGWVRQLAVLSRRYAAVLASDRRNAMLLAVQAPLFGLLYLGLIGLDRFATTYGQQATMLVWLLIVGATWLGTSNSIREIVKEYPIFRRERAFGVSPSAYVLSKVVVLGPITALQATVMVLVVMAGEQLPAADPTHTVTIPRDGAVLSSQLAELCLCVVLAGLAAVALGLFVSTVVRSSDQALVLLPLILITQVIASVPFFVGKPVIQAVGEISSAQWATAAAASTTSLNQVRAIDLATSRAGQSVLFSPSRPRPSTQAQVAEAGSSGNSRWTHDRTTWAVDVIALLALAAVPIAAAIAVLSRRDRLPRVT